MTHQQALSGHQPGFEPSACTGHLAEADTFPDSHLGPDGLKDRLISVYVCDACGRTVSVMRQASAETPGCWSLAFRVLNEYGDPREEWRRYVAGIGRPVARR